MAQTNGIAANASIITPSGGGIYNMSAESTASDQSQAQVKRATQEEIAELSSQTQSKTTPSGVPSQPSNQVEDKGTLSTQSDPQIETPDPYTVDGDWVFEGTVTIFASSASKLYDGKPLTCNEVLVYGLPGNFSISATCSGSQTNAGTEKNTVISYTIYNKSNKDVTRHFTSIETVPGQLVVKPVPMTIWTGSATKFYDGTPLTNNEAGIDLVSYNTTRIYRNTSADYEEFSFITPESEHKEPWSDLALALTEKEGEVLYGLSGSVVVYSTNPLTGETAKTTLDAGYKLAVRLYDKPDTTSASQDANKPTIEFVKTYVTEEDLPTEILYLFFNNEFFLSDCCRDANWDEPSIAGRIELLPKFASPTTVKNEVIIDQALENNLIHEFTDIRISVDSGITYYDGKILNDQEAHFTEVDVTHSIKVVATGSQTEIGESENSYTIDWGSENKRNFDVSEDLGTLKVREPINSITIYTSSDSKTYDGTPLENDYVFVSGLPEGYEFYAWVTGSQTDAGWSQNTLGGYYILDSNEEDVTNDFTDVTIELGILLVEPAPLYITTGSASKVYDGAELTDPDITIEGTVYGEYIEVATISTLTDAGSIENDYDFDWGYTNPYNYIVYEELGTLTVEPLIIEVNIGAESTINYSGSVYVPIPTVIYLNGLHAGELALSEGNDGMTFTYTLITGDTLKLDIVGSGSDAGDYTLTASVVSLSNDSNYSLSMPKGSQVTILPASLSISTGSASKPYDGTALTLDDVSVSGLIDGDSITVTATGTITEVGSTENTYEIDWGEVNPDNYTISESLGTLTIEPPLVTEIKVTTGSESKMYDGTPLTCSEAAIAGLRAEDEGKVTITANGTITDVGTAENTYEIDWGEVDPDSYTITEESLGTLEVTPKEITVTTDSDSKEYDGTPLTNDNVTITGLVEEETVSVTATGTITDAGNQTNTYEIDWTLGTAKEINYTVMEDLGTLTVEPAAVVFDLDCEGKIFDGCPVFPGQISGTYADGNPVLQDYEVEDRDDYGNIISITSVFYLVGEDEVQLYSTGSESVNAGDFTVTPEVTMMTGEQNNYTFSFKNNKGTITPRDFELSLSDGVNVYYDGLFHGGNLNVLDEDEFYWVENESIGDGFTTWKVYCTNGDIIDVTINGGGVEDNTYSLSCIYEFSSGTESNYNIWVANDSLTITTWDIAITLTSDTTSKPYDGTPLTAEDVNISVTEGWLPSTWQLIAVATGSQTEIGSSENTIEYYIYNEYCVDITQVFSSNVTLVPGTLTITSLVYITYYIDMSNNKDGIYGDVLVEGAVCTPYKISDSEWKVTLPDSSVFEVIFLKEGESNLLNETPIPGQAVTYGIFPDELPENYSIDYRGCCFVVSSDEFSDGKIIYHWVPDDRIGTLELNGIGVDGCNYFILLDYNAFMNYYKSVESTMSSTQIARALLSKGIIKKP